MATSESLTSVTVLTLGVTPDTLPRLGTATPQVAGSAPATYEPPRTAHPRTPRSPPFPTRGNRGPH